MADFRKGVGSPYLACGQWLSLPEDLLPPATVSSLEGGQLHCRLPLHLSHLAAAVMLLFCQTPVPLLPLALSPLQGPEALRMHVCANAACLPGLRVQTLKRRQAGRLPAQPACSAPSARALPPRLYLPRSEGPS